MPNRAARRYLIAGRVQGVGFRNYAQHHARKLDIVGYARNLDDGRVEVLAIGMPEQLSALTGRLRHGPPLADVRHFEDEEAVVTEHTEFRIR